jgi:hypothetical protein
MKVDSLQELESAFAAWRSRKKYRREQMPEELLVRAQRASQVHGVKAVVGVTRVERGRLLGKTPGSAQAAPRAKGGLAGSVPAFSRVTLSAPSAAGSSARPIAEVELSGATLRVFEPTAELMALLSAACGVGGTR